MNESVPTPIRLADYTPFPFLIDGVELTFRLDPKATRVCSRIRFRPNPDAPPGPFFLNGEGLTFISAQIDGAEITPRVCSRGLDADAPDAPFLFEAEVEINPSANTALEGLYMSKGMFATQCEAEGFRRITYYPDRPDVMAPFRVRIEADLPVLLSNGNPVASGPGWAEWDDPWPKPAYLFALVAGDLVAHSDRYTTASGREVALNVWVRPGDEMKCAYAMDALKRSMAWDEEVYGREYDLDVFNIVAVDDFNAGAMENKGLNIFNAKYVLASPETATDRDYELIEGIIAHEYFHNWTGNRITCRDWFQLCLKEGLTVFRDQQFSGDMRGHAVKRIDDVLALRSRQFREDAGPLAHPVRPESYIEINNFYTATVYEKGAEVIRMLKLLVGTAGYRAALDLYFERHDGDAATIEDWLGVFEDATGRDLGQFARWYSQAGTPCLTVSEEMNGATYILHFQQETPATPGQPEKAPQVLPIAVGLLGPNGEESLPTTVLEMTAAAQSFAFHWSAEGWRPGPGDAGEVPPPPKPTPSLLRGFSAPVVLERQSSRAERAFLLAHDTDPFNRWEAGRQLGKEVLIDAVRQDKAAPRDWTDAIAGALRDDTLDPAFRALALALPREDDIAETLHLAGSVPDPTRIHQARRRIKRELAAALGDLPGQLFEAMAVPGPYAPDAASAGRRALRLAALDLLARTDGGAAAEALFASADNMTESIGALKTLLGIGAGEPELTAFYDRWQNDRLVLDKWFSLQPLLAAPGRAAAVAQTLTEHPAFDWKNPNRFRAVLGGLAGNAAGFHAPDGSGYRFFADWLLRLDPVNPQTSARMATVFETWRRYDADRQGMIGDALRRILAAPGLSRDMTEIVGRILAA
ncbi:MAG: aminopeptidase N [Paracoccaceae bacterium]|nr:aminopeptidase N [Paracoccaceae bacterium]